MLSSAERSYHLRQYDEPYQSTRELAAFIRATLRGESVDSLIDVGCGAGATLYWLRKWGTIDARVSRGIDHDADLIDLAHERGTTSEFIVGDFLEPIESADVMLSVQTLSFIEDWRMALMRLLLATQRWCFMSSLFWDGVETHTHVWDVGHAAVHYNIIDTREFERQARQLGAQEVRWREFRADGLRSSRDALGSRSEACGTFSGPLYLPWRFVAVRMREGA